MQSVSIQDSPQLLADLQQLRDKMKTPRQLLQQEKSQKWTKMGFNHRIIELSNLNKYVAMSNNKSRLHYALSNKTICIYIYLYIATISILMI